MSAKQPKGRKFDGGKERWDLLPFRAVNEIVKVLTFGAKKYEDNNWQHIPNLRDRYLAALERHIKDWKLGERNDPESGISHLAHAGCCLVFLLSEEVGFDPTKIGPQ